MAKEFKITSLRLADLEKELNYLKTTREREVAAMIAEARSYGDLSENSEYDAAKNEQAKNEYDIVQLENELRNAKVIDETQIDTSIVGVGAIVKMKNADSGMELTYQIVGSAETDPVQGKISNESPVGRSLLGHAVGETVDVTTPGGTMRLTIQSIGR